MTLTDVANGYSIADAVMLLPAGVPPDSAVWTPNVLNGGNYHVLCRSICGHRAADMPVDAKRILKLAVANECNCVNKTVPP